jgi:hypothetical protein
LSVSHDLVVGNFAPAPRASARFRRATEAVFYVNFPLAAERLWPEVPLPPSAAGMS